MVDKSINSGLYFKKLVCGKTSSTASQKALFFNLKKIKQQINDVSREFMGQDEINKVSNMLNVKSLEVQNMESRLSGGDLHLNQK